MTALYELISSVMNRPFGPVLVLAGLVALASVVYLVLSARDARSTARRRLKVDLPQPRTDAGKPASSASEAAAPLVIELPRKRNSLLMDKAVAHADSLVKTMDAGKIKLVRQRLVQAGFFDQNAVAVFFLARVVLAVVLPLATVLALYASGRDTSGSLFYGALLLSFIGGYLAPSFYVDRSAKAVMRQNRTAFPDFMDLMGVCANAGLSMEAGLERVSRELAPLYPALGVNLQIVCLEVRAGRPIEVSLQSLSDRLNVPEVRAFATLLQQSKELGSSLSDALRVFSDDMRHQRLAAAEEKAYALPAKLSVPVTACILPVVLFVAIWPVVVHFKG